MQVIQDYQTGRKKDCITPLYNDTKNVKITKLEHFFKGYATTSTVEI